MDGIWYPQKIRFSSEADKTHSERPESEGELSPVTNFPPRTIIVSKFLPLHSQRDPATNKWSFSWDEDALMLQIKDGISAGTEVVFVGCLRVPVDVSEQDEVAQTLFERFKCVPTFLSPELWKQFYHGFCKQQLWPLFHYMLPMLPDIGGRFDRSLYLAYVTANLKFADKVNLLMRSDKDYVWIHDYHLILVPTFLRKRMNRAKIGFFLHTPFPSSEIYRTLPIRDELLKALLNADLIGFQTYDIARHFLSCCSRMLGLDYELKHGYIGLEYLGRIISVKILPIGVHVGWLESILNMPKTIEKVGEIEERFKGKILFLGIDDMDIFKGIGLKLLAMEMLLEKRPRLRGKIVLVQIVNPARSRTKDVEEATDEMLSVVERINTAYKLPGYDPVVLITDPIPCYEKLAYCAVAECCTVNAVRDGMNLLPYEYVVCRQGTDEMNRLRGIEIGSPRTSTLIVSEFVGCSRSLSGALRINPWNVEQVYEALASAIKMPEQEKRLRHEKHYRFVSCHNITFWASSFMRDLQRACSDHYKRTYLGIGLGANFRLIALSPTFRRLVPDLIVPSYKKANRRAILLDYDGTLMPKSTLEKTPSGKLISVLSCLCGDPKNTVFIVSGRDQEALSRLFSTCKGIGITAEHGYFIRWNNEATWEPETAPADVEWKKTVEPIMKLYTEATDGSFIERKKSAIVWHHFDADPDFGSCQAKELLSHLENVLANEPVVVTRGQHIVEVKPQGVGKGLFLDKLVSRMAAEGAPPDFVMCVGDDRSDEDMFESISSLTSSSTFHSSPEVFTCTVGRKPSKAHYYVDETAEVVSILEDLASCEKPKEWSTDKPLIDFVA